MTNINKNKKLKILQIHDYPPFEGGGIEIMVSNLSKEFCNCGNEVIIATSRFNSETFNSNVSSDFRNGVKAVLINDEAQLKELIEWADVVNIHFTFSCRPASMTGLELCAQLNKPCVFSIHTSIEHIPFSALAKMNKFEANTKLSKLSSLLANENIFVSAPSYDVERSLVRLGVDKKLNVIRNPVTLKPQVNSEKEISEVDLTYVGEVSFMKGINYLIDAIKIVREAIPNISLRIIGGGSDFDHMRNAVRYLNVEDNIEFVGYVPNVEIPNYLEKTKIYVHPSLTETWANAVAEALSLNIPVICTNVGGLNELINNGEFANAVEAANANLLAQEIIKVLSSEEEYKNLKSKALSASTFISENYNLQKQSSEFINLVNSLI